MHFVRKGGSVALRVSVCLYVCIGGRGGKEVDIHTYIHTSLMSGLLNIHSVWVGWRGGGVVMVVPKSLVKVMRLHYHINEEILCRREV